MMSVVNATRKARSITGHQFRFATFIDKYEQSIEQKDEFILDFVSMTHCGLCARREPCEIDVKLLEITCVGQTFCMSSHEARSERFWIA